jgi:hypothetical protein
LGQVGARVRSRAAHLHMLAAGHVGGRGIRKRWCVKDAVVGRQPGTWYGDVGKRVWSGVGPSGHVYDEEGGLSTEGCGGCDGL